MSSRSAPPSCTQARFELLADQAESELAADDLVRDDQLLA